MEKKRFAAAASAVVFGLATLVFSAGTAQAAIPGCTSWTTYNSDYGSDLVVHVPTAGYQTGATYCELEYGDHNDAVTVLQRALRYCQKYQIGVDGEYGPETRRTVLAWQQWVNGAYGAGLEEDGEWGPATRNWTDFPVWTRAGNVRTAHCEHSPS
jgi:hypothetical protein